MRPPVTVICALVLLCTGLSGYTQDYPQRIISLGPAITKGLYLLGVEDKLIANTIYCISPPEARKKEKIGNVVKVNIERILSLEPDVVLATSLTAPEAKEKLKSLGIKVITFPAPKDFSQMCEQFLELGKLVGKERRAQEILRDAENRVDSVKGKVKGLPKSKVLIQVGTKPLVAATGRYFVSDYIELAGGVNVAKNAREGIYSREQVLKANPDVIIITTMGIAAEEEKKVWEEYKTLTAVKKDRIYIMDTENLTSPTPPAFARTLEEIAHILHPELSP
ncbi:MAG: ABC transporter substrate-binding protein [Candidatus Omnitrophota bacterium]